ncbi:MAG: DUF58 domain-containing protein [Nitrospira sp.]|nr:DUF58 domain-containing protein [Nitrospira sp.]
MIKQSVLTPFRTIVRRLTQRRSTRFTSEGVQFLLFTCAIGVAAINTGNNLFYLLLAMMLSIILISGIAAESCLRRLEFRRCLPELLFANEPVTATLMIKNRKSRLPSLSLRFFDVCEGRDLDRGLTVGQLQPGAGRLLSYPIVSGKRGWLHLDGVRVTTSFPFGLFLKKAYYPVAGMTCVSPAIKPLSDTFLQDFLVAGQESSIHRRGYGNELYNLRLYQAGDDSRAIHWITTARTSQLIVRETEAEDQRRAAIYLSLFAPDTHDAIFEEAVTFTASLLHHLTLQGYRIQLTAGSFRSLFGQGETHLLDLLRALALCERRAPMGQLSSEIDLSMETDDGNSGGLIVVRPWRGAAISGTPVPPFVVDGDMLVGASHVF